jgi:VanZ family protein
MLSRSSALNDPSSPVAGFSNRIFLLTLAGILFLTLYPFRFALQGNLLPGSSPFLLGSSEKPDHALDIFLNIILFVPLGFGLSERLREKGWSWKRALFVTWIAGALISYTIEFLQIYIPTRDSGWEDVITNSSGAALGCVFFALFGATMVGYLVRLDRLLRTTLTLSRTTVILCIYFGLWFTVSALLQKETHLDDWSPYSQLYLAGDPQIAAAPGWKGTVSALKLWNIVIPDDAARALTRGELPLSTYQGLLASYDFFSSDSMRDQVGLVPDLTWLPRPPNLPEVRELAFDGRSWLASKAPIAGAIHAFQQTNQFSLLIACTPAISSADQRIVSFAQPSGSTDLLLRQENTNLVFWFRNPLSVGHAQLAWNIPDIFFAGRPRRILLSFDGSKLALYVDGRRDPDVYILGPGARLAELIRRIKPVELEGYNYVYDALIFFPAGALLGIAVKGLKSRNLLSYLAVGVLFLLPVWIFAEILSHFSRRSASFNTMALCLVLAIAGSLWINSDRAQEAGLRL